MSEEKKVIMDDLLCCEPDGSPDGGFAYCDRCKTIMAMDSELTSLRAQVERLESRIKEEAQIIAGATAETNTILFKENERLKVYLERAGWRRCDIAACNCNGYHSWNPKPLPENHQRLLDLVRYQRSELHRAALITNDEYLELLEVNGSPRRLESYDSLKHRLEECEKAHSVFHLTLADIARRSRDMPADKITLERIYSEACKVLDEAARKALEGK